VAERQRIWLYQNDTACGGLPDLTAMFHLGCSAKIPLTGNPCFCNYRNMLSASIKTNANQVTRCTDMFSPTRTEAMLPGFDMKEEMLDFYARAIESARSWRSARRAKAVRDDAHTNGWLQ